MSKTAYYQENVSFLLCQLIKFMECFCEKKKTILVRENYEQTKDWVKHAFDLVNYQT